jgi:hypothetical protein
MLHLTHRTKQIVAVLGIVAVVVVGGRGFAANHSGSSHSVQIEAGRGGYN